MKSELLDKKTEFAEMKRQNSRLLKSEIQRKATHFEALPEVVTLNHSNACNLTCAICPRSKGGRATRIPEPVLKRITTALFPTAMKAILTMAGEPLMSDFDFLLDEARRYEVRLDLYTNGLLLKPERYQSMREVLDHINISVDSHIPEVYEKVRRGGSFKRLHANLSALRELRMQESDDVLFTLSAVVMKSNVEHLAEFVRFAAWAGADGVLLQRLHQDLMKLAEYDPKAAYSSQQLADFMEEARIAAELEGINLIQAEMGLPNVMVKPIRAKVAEPMPGICSFLMQNFIVLFDGDVYPCCIPTDHYLGNVYRQDPLDIWNGPAFTRLREAHHSRRGTVFCSGCDQAPYLPPRQPAWFNEGLRKTRRVIRHVVRKATSAGQ